MSDPVAPLTEMPDPQFIMSSDGIAIATYTWGEADAPTVLCVHGFASSSRDNWVNTGWVRDLTRAGYRVLAVDQRGHGASEKPHDSRVYTMPALVNDLVTVLDTYLIDEVRYLGYSLGARVGWQFAVDVPHHVTRSVLGGIPDGTPLARLKIDQARAYAEDGIDVEDPVTRNYITLAERVQGNDIKALIALAEGMRLGDNEPDATRPPQIPVLFATGTEDAIFERSRALSDATPTGTFAPIEGRHHFNTPGSRDFRQQAIAFFGSV
jgi:pimeloyl-ACP methyl ester carboxylesterase